MHVPARIQWEIEALSRTEQLGTSMVHQWGHWVDRTTSRRTGVNSQSGIGEIYISILRQNGHTLRDYLEYTNLRTEEQRKVFLIRLKQVTVKQIMRYAEHDGIFHGDLNIGNIYIIPVMQKTERLRQGPLYMPVSFEVRFTDWGYTRKVIPNLQACDDTWLVPGVMVLPDRERQAPQYVRDYVGVLFRVPWQLMKESRGGVDKWHTVLEGLCAPSGKFKALPIVQPRAGSYIFNEHDTQSSSASCKAPTPVKDKKVPSLHRRNNGKYTLGPDPTIEMLGEYPYISIGEETNTPFSCVTRLTESFIVQDEGYSTGVLCGDPDNKSLYVKVFNNVELTQREGSSLFYPSSLRVAMEINALRSTGQIKKWKYYVDPTYRRRQPKAKGQIYLYIERPEGYYLVKDIPHRWQAPIDFQQHFTRNLYLAVQGAIYHYAKEFGIFNGHALDPWKRLRRIS
ncbi:hypothetical protein BJ165DRAFT_1612644 [Panaeolus papilionaceus]|nr:hypothetical protein BJ165DRAFT_1612644 [Panaeolus papilionaceus]